MTAAPARRVIVTRPRQQAASALAELRELGLEAEALPLIGIESLDDACALHVVREQWQRLRHRRLVMFVSANAVAAFFDARPEGAAWPPGTLAASTGPGTTAALRANGVPSEAIVEPEASAARFDSEALWERLAALDWHGQAALIVRGEQGRDWLADTLRAAGAEVSFVAAYRRVAPRWSAQERALLGEALAEPGRHCWHFSSSEALVHLRALVPDADWSSSVALATHPRIAEAVRQAGFGEVRIVAASPAAVARALAEWIEGSAR
jgi:uroporphyrinogen-III synthase